MLRTPRPHKVRQGLFLHQVAEWYAYASLHIADAGEQLLSLSMNMRAVFRFHVKRMLLKFYHLQILHGNSIVLPFSLAFRHPSEANTVYLSDGLKARADFNDSSFEKWQAASLISMMLLSLSFVLQTQASKAHH